jgi:sarcosine oxidase, subunit beta
MPYTGGCIEDGMENTFDVLIVGGGVIGASTLFQLTQLGCRNVALIDRGDLATGATARSSGIVRTHYSVPINVEVARASLRMFEAFPRLLDDPEASSGLVISGYLIVAPPGKDSDAVKASIDMQKGLGVEASLIDAKEALERHPWLALDDVAMIGYEAEAGFADPYLVTNAFARAARRNGATIKTGTTVTGFLKEGSRVLGVMTDKGPIHAATTISAIGIWSQALAGWAGLDVPLSLNAHSVFTLAAAKPYESQLPILKDLASPGRLYMRPMSGNLLVGAGNDGYATDDPDSPEVDVDMDSIVDEAAQAANRLPAFSDGRLVRSWSGIYDTTPDWNPVLGPVPGIDGLQVAFGFSGHGFKLSPMIGRMLAQSALGQETDLPVRPYRITRFAENDLLVGRYGPGAVS